MVAGIAFVAVFVLQVLATMNTYGGRLYFTNVAAEQWEATGEVAPVFLLSPEYLALPILAGLVALIAPSAFRDAGTGIIKR